MAKSKYLNQKDIDQLKEALRAAKFENADFGTNDEFIKERTRIYRETWIISRIESVLTKLGEL